MLHRLSPRTKSNLASPSTFIALPFAAASFTALFPFVLTTPFFLSGHTLRAAPESTVTSTTSWTNSTSSMLYFSAPKLLHFHPAHSLPRALPHDLKPGGHVKPPNTDFLALLVTLFHPASVCSAKASTSTSLSFSHSSIPPTIQTLPTSSSCPQVHVPVLHLAH